MPKTLLIEAWQWDESNLEELRQHRLSVAIVEQVAEGEPRFRANRRRRAATHQMIGSDYGGTFWVICIVQVPGQPSVWRAITGWRAEGSERDWYRRAK